MPSFVSLYSGCGGLDLGFLQAGFLCQHAFEIDKLAVEVHSANLDSPVTKCDLSNREDSILQEVSKADILIAGPPCQGFSTAGKNNPNDLRNKHLNNVAKIAAQAKPKVVLIENVKGLLSSANRDNFNEVKSTLRGAGYSVSWDLHNVADYGVAQNRKRVLILAVRSSTPIELKPKCQPKKTLRDAISDLGPADLGGYESISGDTKEYKIVRRIKPGQKLSNVRSGDNYIHTWRIPEVYGSVTESEVVFLETIIKLRRQQRRRSFGDADPVSKKNIEKIFGLQAEKLAKNLLEKEYLRDFGNFIDIANTFNGKFRRLVWDEAAPTVDTRFGQLRHFLHPQEHRGFSVREAARIQGFPDDFTFSGSDSAKFRMIGNAVPPRFAKAIAEFIEKAVIEI